MSLLDFLKRKKNIEKAKKAEKKPSGFAVEKEKKQKESAEKKPLSREYPAKAGAGAFSYEVIKRPRISEKASYLAQSGQYIFEVSPNYNKNEIKRGVEGIYGVNVLSVNVIKIPPKKRRLGKTEGFRKGYKKVVVKIKKGQKIEVL